MIRRWLPAASLVILATACGGDHDHSGTTGSVDQGTESAGSVPGTAAAPSEADREVIVEASDELRFDPSSVDVSAGEVITFVVRNEGKTDHEFVLGDEGYQHEHEEDMAGGGHHMAEMENAVNVGPGETAELTWRFEDAGEVLYGCHEPGHYDGGMVGTIEVG